MGKLSEWFNFDNIGTKIKNFAKWGCWIGIILVWVTALITFIVLTSWGPICLIPLIAAIILPFIIWVSSWSLYAFGELVEKSIDTNKIAKKIEMNARNLDADSPKSKKSKPPIKESSEKEKTITKPTESIIYDLPIYSPSNRNPCDKEIHKKYKDIVGNNIGVTTKDGHWEVDAILNEKVFVCNHCHGIIAFETELNIY